MTTHKNTKKYILTLAIAFTFYSLIWALPTPTYHQTEKQSFLTETTEKEEIEDIDFSSNRLYSAFECDTVSEEVLLPDPPDSTLRSPIPDYDNNPLDGNPFYSPFHLSTPNSYHTDIEYDPDSHQYNFQNMIGNTPYGPSSSMSVKDYIDYDLKESINDYWRERGASYTSSANRRGGGLIPQLHIGGDLFESIFGSNTIDIRPSGNVELIFGVLHNRNDNPSLPVKQRKVTQFNFDENIQLNALAKIGDKIEFNLNYNTEAMFEFENEMKLKFEGKEDDILQLIEFGNITMPLNSTLITGSQSLFGVKTQLKFGKLMVTAVASEQKAETQTITVSGGAQTNDFYFKADEYEENRHYFLNQFFYDHYNQYLETLPLVSSPIVITKIEVWRTTIGSATQDNRNIVAFTDLGESNPQFAGFTSNPGRFYPCDSSNNLTSVLDTSLYRDLGSVNNNLRSRGLTSGVDYEKVESARLLSSNEYTFNSQLGFISLNTALTSDQVLAVAYQYTIIGDDHVYQVGEFSNEVSAPNCLRVKLLKSTTLDTKSPLWKLMMKNIYNLGAYQVSNEDFILNILYTGDDEGIANGFFNLGEQRGIPLIRLMGLDKMNKQQDPTPDGIFDFIDNASTRGGTINSSNGKIFFPTVEPFGKDLRAVLTDPELANRYAFDSLYSTTKTLAQQYTAKNKYYLEGSYKSSYGSEIYLNAMNIPEGSVKVTAGGLNLTENVDYTVNYSMGTVSIINQGVLNSGTPISISLENQSTYGMNDQRMFGLNLDYIFNDNCNIGATILNLNERPLTQKVNYGDEPINNTIWGMNFNYKTKVPFVTKAIDLLTFHSTTAESNLQLEGEFAHFIPGHSRAVGKEGTTYIDDFEATKSTVDLRSVYKWSLASTPQMQLQMFPEAITSDSDPVRRQLAYGYNRAKFCWYIIDPIFYRNNNATPSNITEADQSETYAREVYETELFPYKETANGTPTNISVLNLAFYPSERGPYNYDVDGSEGLSAGLNSDGTLNDPESRWGGIMREMENTDFESSNYEYIEFWMMDPFIDNPNHRGGKLYFNLGDISEDILKDGKKFYENGLPADGTDENVEFTVWGRVPTTQMIVTAFDNDNDARQHQDVGIDGLPTSREKTFFKNEYIDRIEARFGNGSDAYAQAMLDPSADDYHYFRGSDYDSRDIKILDRYKYYNNPEGNSPTDSQSPESYPTTGTNVPTMEDVNNDNTLNEDEKYYQYVIDLRPEKMNVGENYINDVFEAVPEPLPDGTRPTTKWYQFKIPIKSPDKVVGNISGFNSIRFMRLFMREFSEPIICRLATFELVRSDWRTYSMNLMEDGDYLPSQGNGETSFNVSSLSYEENGNRTPVPYVLPPGIEREQGFGSTNIYYTNEQTLTMKAQNLMDGDARAIYKATKYDLRKFKKLKMFIHAEKVNEDDILNKGDITVFIRLGSDFTENYYEYEIPVDITQWNCGKDENAIWPEANQMEIILDSLVSVKQARNMDVRHGIHSSAKVPYTINNGNNRITVVGTPNLADVATIMIGIRNPKKKSLGDNDDMLSKSAEVWVNELRLCDFDDKQGFAALARMRLNLADIGDITLSGTYSTPGFGSLDQSITERQDETLYNIDFATNIEMGKVLFPEKWNVRIPLHYDLSQNVALPQYNPLNPDVKLKEDLKTYDTKAERDSIKRMTTDFVRRQNVNLMNVRKERNFDKPIKIRPWDIENFDFSYAYSEMKSHNVDVEFDNEYSHIGELGYSFNYNPKNIRPFSKAKWLKSKWLQLIRDFNFYPMPKMFTFRTNITRELNEFKYRPKSKGNVIIDTSFVKTFDWTRNYALRWDLAQSLKFEYTATAASRIDEPQGLIDTRTERDSVWRCFGQGGRINTYQQRFDASYQIPINKIPLFSWITATARYNSTYDFTSSSLSLQYLGNTIANSQTLQLNGNVNFVNLYNKVPYLKKVNQGNSGNNKGKGQATKQIKKPGDNSKDQDDEKNKSKDKDKKKGKDKDGKDSVKVNYGKIILDGSVRFLMMLRNVSLSYNSGNGITMPGYMYSPNLIGLNFLNGSPGFAFAFGGQTDIRHIAAEKGWLSTDTLMNYPYQEKHNRVINFRATVEPFKDFRIDVTANRNETSNYTEYYRANSNGEFKSYSPQTTGNFSITQFGLGRFFKDGNELFEAFKACRFELAQRLSANNPNSGGIIDTTGYPVGYGALSPEVLSAAFLSTYGGKNSATVDITSPFPKIPLPNWRLNYTGFTKIKGVNKYFQSLSLLHSYTCVYNIGNYTSNLLYTEDANGFANARDLNGNFIPLRDIGQITISEQLNPLIGFDMTLKNSLMIKVEYKRNRNTSLSFANNQITETTSNEIAVSAGYRIKDITIGFIFSGMKRQIKSDLNLSLSVSVKDNRTVLRKIAEDVNQVSAGALGVTINFSADYQLSQMIGLSLYYDQQINRPYISQTYNNMNLEAGLKVRLMLTQ